MLLIDIGITQRGLPGKHQRTGVTVGKSKLEKSDHTNSKPCAYDEQFSDKMFTRAINVLNLRIIIDCKCNSAAEARTSYICRKRSSITCLIEPLSDPTVPNSEFLILSSSKLLPLLLQCHRKLAAQLQRQPENGQLLAKKLPESKAIITRYALYRRLLSATDLRCRPRVPGTAQNRRTAQALVSLRRCALSTRNTHLRGLLCSITFLRKGPLRIRSGARLLVAQAVRISDLHPSQALPAYLLRRSPTRIRRCVRNMGHPLPFS